MNKEKAALMRFKSPLFLLTVVLCLAWTNAVAVNLPSWESGQPEQHCKSEWTKRGVLDQSMYDFCMRMEREGYDNLVDLADRYSDEPWAQAAVDYSLGEWTKRGVIQFSMVKFQLEQITEGFEDLVYLSEQPGWDKRKYERCSRDWGIQFNMVVYCYEN